MSSSDPAQRALSPDGNDYHWILQSVRVEGLVKPKLSRGHYNFELSVDGREVFRSEQATLSEGVVKWHIQKAFSSNLSSTIEFSLVQSHILRKDIQIGRLPKTASALLSSAGVGYPLTRTKTSDGAPRVIFEIESRKHSEPVSTQQSEGYPSEDVSHPHPLPTGSSPLATPIINEVTGHAQFGEVPETTESTTDTTSQTRHERQGQDEPSEPNLAEAIHESNESAGRLKHGGGQGDVMYDVANNVIDVVTDSDHLWTTLEGYLDTFVDIAGAVAEIHPWAKVAWSLITVAHKVYKGQRDRDAKLFALLQRMNSVYNQVNRATAELGSVKRHHKVLLLLSKQTYECACFIEGYCKNPDSWMRAWKQSVSGKSNKLDDLRDSLEAFNTEFLDQVHVETEIMVLGIAGDVKDLWAEVKEQTVDACLAELVYTPARDQAGATCLMDTRTDILAEITEWALNADETTPKVFFLHGGAGTGKSTIARTIASRFDTTDPKRPRRLGGCFCFSANAKRQDPTSLFPTLARDLAAFDPRFKYALWECIRDSPERRTTNSILEQFRNFMLEPSKKLTVNGTILVIIEALDESGNERLRRPLLAALSKELPELPPSFRVLVTSRPESDILRVFQACPSQVTVRAMPTRLNDLNLLTDIREYVRVTIQDQGVSLGDDCYEELAKRSEGIFQWAFVACEYICGLSDGTQAPRPGFEIPAKRYDRVVGKNDTPARLGQFVAPLDYLYPLVLASVFDPHNEQALDQFRRCMGFILTAYEPLSRSALNVIDKLSGSESLPFSSFLPRMSSLLFGIVEDSDSDSVQVRHTSFRDFLLRNHLPNSAKDGLFNTFYVGHETSHQVMLAQSCLQVLNAQLKFNICYFPTSYRLNRAVTNLDALVHSGISSELSYACRFWAHHLASCGTASNDVVQNMVLKEVAPLLRIRFLFWVEALSLLQAVNTGSQSLQVIIPVLQEVDEDMANFAADALRYIRTFGRVIAESAPHIYLSTLMYSPTASVLADSYLPRYAKTASPCTQRPTQWPSLQCIIPTGEEPVSSVAISRDGKRIVSGSWDRTVRVWDAETGAAVGAALEGHTGIVASVAISRDAKRIVSGSVDNTVRVWDGETGAAVGAALEGHANRVTSVAISRDGKRIVSGSWDNTVRIWDAETGAAVGAALEGHADIVTSVAISRDGKRIVSGSDDNTVRIWDAETGAAVGAALEGHADFVTSVAISRDGKRIVSGSYDNTVRVWDAETGAAVGAALEGHTEDVASVAISRDGKHIVSGSYDNTVRIWDAETGAAVGAALEGHTNGVTSVAISEDGKRIISGSYDNTVRVWHINPEPQRPALCRHREHECNEMYGNQTLNVFLDYRTGWIMVNETDHLLWLPPDDLHRLYTPSCPVIISTSPMIELNLSRMVHGERWAECRTSEE